MNDSFTGNNVISIQRDGNCVFCDVFNFIYNTKDRHSEIRLRFYSSSPKKRHGYLNKIQNYKQMLSSLVRNNRQKFK